jgi:hypothetical protein
MTTIDWQDHVRPGMALREIVQQATVALVAMDAERLEELALCCRDLNRGLEEGGELSQVAGSLPGCGSDLQLLHRVLYETRANLTVLSRLHAMRIRETAVAQSKPAARTEAGQDAPGVWEWWERKVDYGDN